jgi:hypothetical protein
MSTGVIRVGRPMVSVKSVIFENVQKYLERSDWYAAIAEMERLFAIDQNPLVRVRIGDARRKLNHHGAAIREYARAAELFAAKGFADKSLALYTLIVRLDSSNKFAWSKMEMLRANRTVTKLKREPIEYRIPQSSGMVIPRYSFYC